MNIISHGFRFRKEFFSRGVYPAAVVLISCMILSCDIFDPGYRRLRNSIAERFEGKVPVEWSETVKGVITELPVSSKIIVLTFDACGSKRDGYDRELIEYLVREKIPATLFINARWIDKNPDTFRELARNNLFEIENHGMEHKPCSINGRSIYGLKGTGSPSEAVDEIERNGMKIEKLTGRKPRFYRSGTAFYDEYGVEIANMLGYRVIGFSVLGDAGATYNAAQVEKALLKCGPGSIVICHFNHPEKETFEGIIRAIPHLRKRGFRFVKLQDYL